jgi:hypothetical protein
VIVFFSDPSDGPDPPQIEESPPLAFGKKAGSMVFSVLSVLIGSLALWFVLVSLQRFVLERHLGPSGPGDEPTIRTSPSDSSLLVRAYAAATSEVNRLAEARR